jgi:two-component system, OmpR family, alkaline phosphatase synthesis response regulator PhoP
MALASATHPRRPMFRRILVADDEPHILRLIQLNLERAGIEVVTARDGVEALEKLYSQDIDLVILDVMMPRKDGFEVLKEIRKDPQFESLFVIMLTAKDQDYAMFEAYHFGADMYLTKPFNPLEILQSLGF